MAQHTFTPPPTEVESAAQCPHYWVIQPATGPLSQGICQSCGEVRDFKNYVEAATWGESKAAKRANAENSESISRALADRQDHEKAAHQAHEEDE